jgi:hypothetical protein
MRIVAELVVESTEPVSATGALDGFTGLAGLAP